MKRIFKTGCCFIAIVFAVHLLWLPVNAAAEETPSLKGIGLKDPTRVYAQPSTTANVLKSYSQGTVLKYRPYNSTWYVCTVYVRGVKKTGYINANDVENIQTPQVEIRGIALQSPTRVYDRASTQASVLKTYAQGTILKYKTFTSGWYECTVYVNGIRKTGYIKKSDVESATTTQNEVRGIGLQSPTKIYERASTQASVLKTYAQGTILKYKTFTSGWYECTVYVNGIRKTGYIKKSDVENATTTQNEVRGIGLQSPTKVYERASTQASVLKTYAQGTILKYKTFTSGWYECTVYVNGVRKTGYIKKSDVENITATPKEVTGIALQSPTNIYSKASTSSKVLKTYVKGSILKYKTFTSGWYECTVYVNGAKKTGYIKVNDVENATSSPKSVQAMVIADQVTVRSYASSNAPILKSYIMGAILKLKTFTSGWYSCTVYINGKATTGYISKSGLKEFTGNVGIYTSYTSYNITLNQAIDMQMKVDPKADGLGKVPATRDQVAYYLNPDNFSQTDSSYFQFLKLSAFSGTNATDINNNILEGKGVLAGKAEAFITAAKTYNINEIYLISHALLETGNGTSQLAKGIKVNGVTVYNVYGVGATDGCADTCGAQFAYNHGWTTIEKAIIGGAQFVSENYIHAGQDTLYKMRWNPAYMEQYGRAGHQYATDVGWAVKQTSTMVNLYSLLDQYTLIFDVPKYKK
ncbi:N-acetylglucosaminidase [Caenibacillus caldisaponilyticus]|uniref:N-acetylglucosaminidase n=1 Tax=Caenibacillus caldisaponilyticus TaxID=1674942 RepID=UPI002379F626|nr:N-acetylglucosaminidase [Caenibacillus caldisaponilyticus]